MYRVIGVAISIGFSFAAYSEDLKVTIFSNGKMQLNGNYVSLTEMQKAFKNSNAKVWYFRENPESEPHPNAMSVIRLVVDNKLPIMLSTTPDFTTYVDDKGNVHTRE
jgi:hypothetical protein